MTKLALLHGWDNANYTSQCPGMTDPWRNRRKFVDALEKEYEVKVITFPGFCGAEEPKNPWTLDDFASFVRDNLESFKPDFMLGYSFGAAVALNYKLKFDLNQKLILISPAICRRYREQTKKQKIISSVSGAVPKFAKDLLRDFYLSRVIGNPFYAQGTKFLKKSYLGIVGIDLSDNLSDANLNDLCFIFGEKDTATPPELLIEKKPSAKGCIHVLKGGTHDIANTNTDDILAIIRDFVKTKERQ
ncbi:MAG: alpha/beta hydrolase [Alphaproteobacteria bacterium]|nr:alpha/beta hydrolase [Alphaproteobacteria bacterium]